MSGQGTLARRPEFGPYMSLALAAHARFLDGDSEGALHGAAAALILTRGAGDSITERFVRYTQCSALGEQGRHEEVVDRASELLDLIGDQDPVWRAKGLSVLANALASMSRTTQAMEAVSEAQYLLERFGAGSYNHMSASIALAIALQPLRNFELAISTLQALVRQQPQYASYLASEMSLVHATWAATLELAGDQRGASEHYLECLSSALRTLRAAQEDDDDARFAFVRALVYEAFVAERLGEPERARFLLLQVSEPELRADYMEHNLAYLALGRIAIHYGAHDRARVHFRRVVDAAERTGRQLWKLLALDALAELEGLVQGPHDSQPWYREQLRALHQHAVQEASTRAQELRERALMRQLRETSDELSRAALLDPLTGLANRRALTEFLLDDQGELGAVFVDVDHFKQVNDGFSHEIGDLVLARVAELLTECCRGDDLVVRYGGDEFVVICAGGAAGCQAVARRVHAAVRDHDWTALAAGLRVTVSVGVATGILGDPLALADEALYRAKRGGRNQVAVA